MIGWEAAPSIGTWNRFRFLLAGIEGFYAVSERSFRSRETSALRTEAYVPFPILSHPFHPLPFYAFGSEYHVGAELWVKW